MKREHIADVSAKEQPAEVIPLWHAEKLSFAYKVQDETFVVCWEGVLSSEELRLGYLKVVEHARIIKPKKILLDLQKRGTIKREDQRWIFEHVFPEVLRLAGDDVFMAVVLPVTMLHDLVSELNGDELMSEGNFLIMHHFLYQEEAQRWLNEMSQIKSVGS